MHPDVTQLKASVDDNSDKIVDLQGAIQDLREENSEEALQRAILGAMTELLKDKEAMKAFWKGGFDEFASNAGTSVATYIGKRIMTGLLSAVFVGALSWAIVTGRFK